MNENLIPLLSGGFVDYNTKHGAEIYRRSLSVLLECAMQEIAPDLHFQVGQTLMQGYYYEPIEGDIPPAFFGKLRRRMLEICRSDEKFRQVSLTKEDALSLCRKFHREDKYKALKFLPHKKISFVFLRNYFDFVLAESVSSTKWLKTFRILKYNNGFILQFPVRGNILCLPEATDKQRKLYEVYIEAKNWNEVLGIRNAGDINEAISSNEIRNLILVQEAFHEKKIASIAEAIRSDFPRKQIVFIAGPSSSGKTTFIKRLGVQLRACAIIPVEISLDDYFLPREKTPRIKDGRYDFDCLEAIDLKFFRRQITELLNGGTINVPEFDFKAGKKKFSGKKLKLRENSILLIEGIHAINPALAPQIPGGKKWNIFVSALTQMRIDNDNRIFTSDSRLMRRIVRDYKYRGYSAEETIMRFPDVRESEDKYIFPYQKLSDIFFNSSLFYEQAVLKIPVAKLLRKISSKSPAYFEARRLMLYLDFFLPIDERRVPQNSILREFIGRSAFHY